MFQQDFYNTVILKKSMISHEAQYVEWDYMARKNDVIFSEVIVACAHRRIKNLMGFKHSWNREIIAQFCATVFFEHHEGERCLF